MMFAFPLFSPPLCVYADNRSAFLIFSSRHEIRMIDLRMPDIQPILVPSLRNTIAIDFLYDAGEQDRQLVRTTQATNCIGPVTFIAFSGKIAEHYN
jgi:hypothetical protein